jgi:GNAT superfamily N-acetyltransferase
MEAVQTFTASQLPTHFAWQLRDFSRIVWHADITRDIRVSLHPERWHPTYLVIADGEWLISAAAVLWKRVEVQHQRYKIGGLGMVLTYPEYRKQGYGRQIVAAATALIQQTPDADLALLQTAPDLAGLYKLHGWNHNPRLKILSGDPSNPIDEKGWFMMMFLSERAKRHQTAFESAPFYLDEHIW